MQETTVYVLFKSFFCGRDSGRKKMQETNDNDHDDDDDDDDFARLIY